MKGRLAGLAGVGVAAATLAVPAGASGATVTIGSPLTSEYVNLMANAAGTIAMVSGPNIASPVDGTVISWRTKDFQGTFRARVLKIGAGFTATGAGTSPPISLTGGTVDSPLNLPIHKGEVVGFDATSPGDRADLAMSSATYRSASWLTVPDNGSPAAPMDSGPYEFAYNATVRYCLVPNVVGMTLGAAGAALSQADCTLGSVAIKKPKKKKGKRRKGPKIVVAQASPAGASLADQAPVDVTAKVKPKKKKRKKK